MVKEIMQAFSIVSCNLIVFYKTKSFCFQRMYGRMKDNYNFLKFYDDNVQEKTKYAEYYIWYD